MGWMLTCPARSRTGATPVVGRGWVLLLGWDLEAHLGGVGRVGGVQWCGLLCLLGGGLLGGGLLGGLERRPLRRVDPGRDRRCGHGRCGLRGCDRCRGTDRGGRGRLLEERRAGRRRGVPGRPFPRRVGALAPGLPVPGERHLQHPAHGEFRPGLAQRGADGLLEVPGHPEGAVAVVVADRRVTQFGGHGDRQHHLRVSVGPDRRGAGVHVLLLDLLTDLDDRTADRGAGPVAERLDSGDRAGGSLVEEVVCAHAVFLLVCCVLSSTIEAKPPRAREGVSPGHPADRSVDPGRWNGQKAHQASALGSPSTLPVARTFFSISRRRAMAPAAMLMSNGSDHHQPSVRFPFCGRKLMATCSTGWPCIRKPAAYRWTWARYCCPGPLAFLSRSEATPRILWSMIVAVGRWYRSALPVIAVPSCR